MRERIKGAQRQRAEEGLPQGNVAFGWRRQYYVDAAGRIVGGHNVENPQTAPVVREIDDRLLAGDTLRNIVSDLNARGVPAPRGGVWKSTIVRQTALRAVNAGLSVYGRRSLGDGSWLPPLVSRDQHDCVVALLTAPERMARRPGRRVHLLSYAPFGLCGACGAQLGAMRDKLRPASSERRWVYRCESPGACVLRSLEDVDRQVAGVVAKTLKRSNSSLFDDADDAAQEARKEIEAVRARMDLAARAFSAGGIKRAQLKTIRAELRLELQAAQEALRRTLPPVLPPAAYGLLGDQPAEVWGDLPVTAKRAVLERLGVRVVLHPIRISGGFPDGIEIRLGSPRIVT